ncbi:MAG: hypothetical protein ACXWQO_07280, partial [Bdellovibrionota bacterium]
KFILPALAAIALSTSAFAANVGARNTVLECTGTLSNLSGDFNNGIKETPVAASIKISGQDPMRYGTRVRLNSIEVKYGEETILVKDVEKAPKYNHYEVVQPYDNLMIVDLSWYQNFRDSKNKKWVTPNNIVIKGLPKTMNTTGDGTDAQDGATRSTFDAKIDLSITNGNGKVDYTSHTATGTLSCVYSESL